MIRLATATLVVGLAASVLGAHARDVTTNTTTWTGWFSDRQCAAPRVAKGEIGPNNPDCMKRCLEQGAKPVFISEQAKALFDVEDYPSVKDDLGYHIELTGIVNETAKTISVIAVKRLEYVGASCALPKKPRAGR